MTARIAPMDSDPTSPIKTSAGYVLCQRNPNPAPARAAHMYKYLPSANHVGHIQIIGEIDIAMDISKYC